MNNLTGTSMGNSIVIKRVIDSVGMHVVVDRSGHGLGSTWYHAEGGGEWEAKINARQEAKRVSRITGLPVVDLTEDEPEEL